MWTFNSAVATATSPLATSRHLLSIDDVIGEWFLLFAHGRDSRVEFLLRTAQNVFLECLTVSIGGDGVREITATTIENALLATSERLQGESFEVGEGVDIAGAFFVASSSPSLVLFCSGRSQVIRVRRQKTWRLCATTKGRRYLGISLPLGAPATCVVEEEVQPGDRLLLLPPSIDAISDRMSLEIVQGLSLVTAAHEICNSHETTSERTRPGACVVVEFVLETESENKHES